MNLPLEGRTYDVPAFLAHDWHAALLPAYLKTAQHCGLLKGASTSMVIHNLAHQGVVGAF